MMILYFAIDTVCRTCSRLYDAVSAQASAGFHLVFLHENAKQKNNKNTFLEAFAQLCWLNKTNINGAFVTCFEEE